MCGHYIIDASTNFFFRDLYQYTESIMQARQSNGLQSRRTQPQQRGAQNLWLRSSKPALGNGARYGPPHTQLYQASGGAPGAAALQEGARTTNFRVGHGSGTGPLPYVNFTLLVFLFRA